MDIIDQIYAALGESPQKALTLAEQALSNEKINSDFDGINWAKAYALVDLKRFDEANLIWMENFERTGNHRALHQVGMVERDAGQPDVALEIYHREKMMVDKSDSVAVGANLYELTYCNILKGQSAEAFKRFAEFETLHCDDLVERGCFSRPCGRRHLQHGFLGLSWASSCL
ncbi:MAG: hypothetical protein IPM97_10200 [Bdellovibrionaceae bacterium]|nr:hypothetical protein [Pseudobdellovibrionaceae bacterium]